MKNVKNETNYCETRILVLNTGLELMDGLSFRTFGFIVVKW